MVSDLGEKLGTLKVDGGASVNDGLMQFQADMLDVVVRRPVVAETTALGAAYLAGLAVGVWDSLEDIASNWALDKQFTGQSSEGLRDQRRERWQKAVTRTLNWDQ